MFTKLMGRCLSVLSIRHDTGRGFQGKRVLWNLALVLMPKASSSLTSITRAEATSSTQPTTIRTERYAFPRRDPA